MSAHNLAGQTLGDYELRELLGMGGMGAVYRAYQADLQRYVAVKVLAEALTDDPHYLERFTREARTAAGLEHPHIVPIYDYGTQGRLSYVVMRLLTGGGLDQRLRARREIGESAPLPSLGEIAALLGQLAGALDYAHSRGVIHRDIKPSNIMFDQHGNAFLVDFGIAKLAQESNALTGEGTVLGTPSYMAPEQWRAEPPTPATDQYALGVMTYALVTGQVPFDAPTPFALMHQHCEATPTAPHTVRADVPEDVTEVVTRAMAKRAEDRFPTVTAFAQAFDHAAHGATGTRTGFFATPPRSLTTSTSAPPTYLTPPPPVPAPPLYRRPLPWVIGIALIAAVVLGMLFASGGEKKKDQGIGMIPTSVTPDPIVTPTDSATLNATPEPSPTPLPTHDLPATAEALLAERLTQTAAQWTFTPTPNLEASVAAAITRTAQSWTLTPTITASPTATPTLTETPTATVTLSLTPTATVTTSPTWTASPIPTFTPTITASPRPDFFAAGTSNRVWTPEQREVNGLVLVYVPSGCFLMGSVSGETDEQPVHHVCLHAFWIGQTEVSNAQYAACVNAGACTAPSEKKYTDKKHADLPASDVTWEQAAAFAQWFGGSLPTEAQWEYASRGPEGWTYPWGPNFDGSRLNFCDARCKSSWHDSSVNDGHDKLAAVGIYPGGASWVGALDLAGNAWEWTADWYGETYYGTLTDGAWDPGGPGSGSQRVLKGGAWFNAADTTRPAFRGWLDPDFLHPSLGFRVIVAAE